MFSVSSAFSTININKISKNQAILLYNKIKNCIWFYLNINNTEFYFIKFTLQRENVYFLWKSSKLIGLKHQYWCFLILMSIRKFSKYFFTFRNFYVFWRNYSSLLNTSLWLVFLQHFLLLKLFLFSHGNVMI